MSLQSVTGNFIHDTSDSISTIITGARSTFDGIVGTATAGLSSLWSGGFVGMSEAGIEELKNAINTYCNDVQSIIDGFNEEGDIDGAFKGETNVAAREFIRAVKALLNAYVSTMRKFKDEANEAWTNWKQSSQDISTQVQANADDIRSQASGINIDA